VKFSLFYPVAVASAAELGTRLLGLDRAYYQVAIQELREQAQCADECGWTSLMLAEHHFEVEGYQVTPNPLMLNVFLAQHLASAAVHHADAEPGAPGVGGGVALCRLLSVASTHEQAWESARQAMAFTADWLGEFGFFEAWRLPGQQGPVPRTLEQAAAAGAMLVGTPDEVGEQVVRLREETGVSSSSSVAVYPSLKMR
jgi:alkanesulfonate monooxygenase SsuD/methylene tetrahydromethanopterin reductase-like flavin-dependent oxidoreductase (luciferase family)